MIREYNFRPGPQISDKKTMRLILLLMLFYCPTLQAQSLKGMWHAKATNAERQLRFILQVRHFILNHQEELFHEEARTSRLQWSFFNLAYAQARAQCLYGGFPSSRVMVNGRSLCDRPHAHNANYAKLANQFGCSGRESYLCNPALFGTGQENQGICLPLKTKSDVDNITFNCEKEFQKVLAADNTSVGSYLADKLNNKEEPFYGQWMETLSILDEQQNCPPRLAWCKLVREKVQNLTALLEADLTPSGNDEPINQTTGRSIAQHHSHNHEHEHEHEQTSENSARRRGGEVAAVGAPGKGLKRMNYSYPVPEPGSPIRSLEGHSSHVATQIKSPHRGYSAHGPGYGATFFGYGFLHPESEFQALESANFSCDENATGQRHRALCEAYNKDLNLPIDVLKTFAEPIFEAGARNQLFEYHALNLKASGKPLGKKPDCIDEELYQKLQALPNSYPVDRSHLSNQFAQVPLAADELGLLNKFSAQGYGQSLESILRNIYVHEGIRQQVAQQSAQNSPFVEMSNERLSYLRQSSSAYRHASQQQLEGVLNDLYLLLGNGNREAGQNALQKAGLASARGYDDFADEVQRKLFANSDLRNRLIAKLKDIRETDLNKSQQGSGGICETPLKEIITSYPNVIRQMLIDNPQDRVLNQFILCKYPEFEEQIKTSDQIRRASTCHLARQRTEKKPDGDVIRLSHERSIFVPKDKSKPIEVNLAPGVSVSQESFPGMTADSPRFKTMLQDWEKKVNAYYAEQSRDFNQRPGVEALPRQVKFNIKFEPKTSGASSIEIHECVDSSIKGRCVDVIEANYQSCLKRPTNNPTELKSSCLGLRDNRLREYRAGNFSKLPQRWTSATFTPQISPTGLVHEIGHHLGLSDEYVGGMFRSIASDNSIMSTGENLQRRHFEDMVFKHTSCLEAD
jgi:hypothetical protein